MDKKGQMMEFVEFIQKIASVIRDGNNTSSFVRTMFDQILTEEGQDLLKKYSDNSFKGYFNGHTSISRISKKFCTYLDPTDLTNYINSLPLAVKQNLCNVFSDSISGLTIRNVGKQISNLFISIITEAAGYTKKSVSIGAKGNNKTSSSNNELIKNMEIAHDDNEDSSSADKSIFNKYLDAATKYYSTKKTLLYAEKPHPFYELYVCNDLCYEKYMSGSSRNKLLITIHNATVEKLEAESRYIIIEGTGGIGKSMFLNHLFLTSAKEANTTGRTPLLLLLKDYRSSTQDMVDFIYDSVREYDSEIKQTDITTALKQKSLILLLDGFDEIQSSIRDKFNRDLESFVKAFYGNTIIMTSRPVNSFISYSKFDIFSIEALSKKQAIKLIKKLQFWDEEAKENFINALDKSLYVSHREFASNPLLLTIMLMTYSSFGEVPAKMHVFYSKAYETMARLHDATKGSFKRPLHTHLTPEEFKKYFSEFCARTYQKEIIEFDYSTFDEYMKKVMNRAHQNIPSRDFLLDLTENLCIMYREGETYYFIHRSFQEYFAAVYFASEYDAKLGKVGKFFEKTKNRSYSDRTFDMLYDMIPEKVERYIFLPYLETLIQDCEKSGSDEYWNFLETIYPILYYEEGESGDFYENEPSSFLYDRITEFKNLRQGSDLNDLSWPSQIYKLPTENWFEIYSEFMNSENFERFPNPENIPDELLESKLPVMEEDIPIGYTTYFGDPEEVGLTVEINIYELRKFSQKYDKVREFMEQPDFPLVKEYKDIKNYYNELKLQAEEDDSSDDLFDD